MITLIGSFNLLKFIEVVYMPQRQFDLIEQSGLSLFELTQQFMLQAKMSPLQFVKELRKYKEAVALAELQPVDNTYALFDPQKN